MTAIVGRLRPQVRVVDVDLEGARGDAAVELVAAWCRQKDLWHLVRPSGGGHGRAHVFVAVDDLAAELETHVAQIREQLRGTRRALDVRDTVRPLSSPHRSGAATKPFGNLSEALLGLRRHPWATMPHKPRKRRSGAPVSATAAVPIRRRHRTDLPGPWRDYLAHGALPLIRVDDPEHPRSNYEATATAVLLRHGYDADEAWRTIQAAHPSAFTKTRKQGHSWWVKYVWNKAVADDDTFIPVGTAQIDPALAGAIHAAQDALEDLAWRLPARQRPALLLVGHAVLDRMSRVGALRVPVPERDLVLDTGLSDRKTIRAQLRLLHGPLGTLHTEVWDPIHKRDTSSFEFEVPPVEGVGEIPPPSLHTPLPRGCWAALPRPSHQLWRALRKSPRPVTTEELVVQALITDHRSSSPSPHQIRAARVALRALAEAGLAVCSAQGTWLASTRPTRKHVEQSRAEFDTCQEHVEAERIAYRSGGSSAWNIARAAAHKAQRAREVSWWEGLPADERTARRESLARRFQSSSVVQQEELKRSLADRRIRHGGDEAARYRSWLASLSDDELGWRSYTRAAAFATLGPPLQQALVAAWNRHRSHYKLPYRTGVVSIRLEQHTLLPVGARERDDAFWIQQSLPISSGEGRRYG